MTKRCYNQVLVCQGDHTPFLNGAFPFPVFLNFGLLLHLMKQNCCNLIKIGQPLLASLFNFNQQEGRQVGRQVGGQYQLNYEYELALESADSENIHLLHKAGLQFDWFGFSSFATQEQHHIFLFDRIQSCLTGDQPLSDISPYKVSEWFSGLSCEDKASILAV